MKSNRGSCIGPWVPRTSSRYLSTAAMHGSPPRENSISSKFAPCNSNRVVWMLTPLRFSANSSIFSPAVNFNYVIRYSMITTYSDVLLVMNCCFASTVSLAPNMELLAASAGNEITPTPESAVSFPKVMHAAMRSFGGNQYTVAELHSMIMRANVTAATPVYVQRGTHKDGSILLPNLQRRTDEPPPKLFNQAEDDRILASIRNNRERYVLIKVTLSTAPTLASAEEFYRWLSTDMPSHVNDISLEGVFSGSGVLLIRLPIAVWSGIRDNSTFSFVCFVSSSNLMVPESSRRLQSSSGETSLPSSHFSAQSASSTAATDPHIEASPEREAGRQLSGSD